MRKIVIIPAFNEEKAIAGVLHDVRKHAPDFDVLVINDGSVDGTSKIAGETGIASVVDLPKNLGIGGAVQTGFIYAVRKGYDIAVQIDGDGQHNPEEISRLVDPILKGESDVVIGSRFVSDSSFRSSLPRRLGIKMFTLMNKILLQENITDSTSGFRSYNRKALDILFRDYPDDYPEPEAVYILIKSGLRVIEIGATMNERQGGRSSITFHKSLFYMVKVFLAIFVRMMKKKK
ncbi:MAG: glycosyltransferase family 2 protein [Acidobacteriota bacterium]|nr:glycosyltransferase family 2 protein [Acidobacteriota bacterium]